VSDPRADPHAAHRAARRLALAAVFEADFGQRTAASALERQLADLGIDDDSASYARSLVDGVVRNRDSIDARIEAAAPAYPVVQLARIDRALLRSALGELLHSAATPARVVIAEWVGLARTYSGEPARRLLNGVLGRIADEAGLAAPTGRDGDRESRRSRAGGTRPPR
jgi:N utilization substance protein B